LLSFPVPPPGCCPKADVPVSFLLKLFLPVGIVVPKQLIAVVGSTIRYKGKLYTRLGMCECKVNHETTASIFCLNRLHPEYRSYPRRNTLFKRSLFLKVRNRFISGIKKGFDFLQQGAFAFLIALTDMAAIDEVSKQT
jgi:hypothetical protein